MLNGYLAAGRFARAAVLWPLLALSLLLGCTASLAHKASDAYLMLRPSVDADAGAPAQARSTRAELSIALKDLDAALPALDANDDRSLSWGEVRHALPAIIGWVESGFRWRCANAPATPAFEFDSLERRSDGAYVRLAAPLPDCAAPRELALDYRLFEGIDASHRLLVAGRLDAHPVAFTVAPRSVAPLVLRAQRQGAAASSAEAAAPSRRSGPATLAQFFPEGVHHILTGLDHLAFLLTLLLPIRLFRARGARAAEAAASLTAAPATMSRHGFSALLLTVTAFTVGHSLTLGLASLGWISASPALVEPAIAITIALSAALNLYPLPHLRGDALALVFGLIHGLGFSSVMVEAGIQGSLLLWGLAGFNLGVEAGQLLVVLGWCALQWLLVRLSLYQPVLVRAGSWALIALAGYWTLQRISA